MKKINIIFTVLFSISAIFISAGDVFAVSCPWLRDYCPGVGGLAGWWGTLSPTYYECATTYYTYNSENLGEEESYYKSTAISLMCGEPTPPFGPTYYDSVASRAYIPAYDVNQTSSAHYYRWQSGSNYTLLGTVDQYNTLGWAWLAPSDWVFADEWKLSDWTNENYMEHTVNLDKFSVSCPNE